MAQHLSASVLAVQLYTVCDFTRTEQGFAESLRKIADIGYAGVQLSAVGAMDGDSPAVSAALARKMLDDNGLKCAATHRSWAELRDRTDDTIAFHHELGCDFVAIGSVPGGYDSVDGYRRFVADAVPVIARLKNAGIRFGYHNHAFEFVRVTNTPGVETLWDVFAVEGGADFLLEPDLFWMWHAGYDPAVGLAKCAGRVPLVHLKDKEIVSGNDSVMAPVGEGNLPWNRLIPACQAARVEWYAVEQDVCRRDPFDCLASSFRYLTQE